jgi:hypothetical protein
MFLILKDKGLEDGELSIRQSTISGTYLGLWPHKYNYRQWVELQQNWACWQREHEREEKNVSTAVRWIERHSLRTVHLRGRSPQFLLSRGTRKPSRCQRDEY